MVQRADDMAENIGRNDQAEYTGRSIVLFKKQEGQGDAESATRIQSLLRNLAGVKAMASSLDATVETYDAAEADAAEGMMLPHVGMAVLPEGTDTASMSSKAADPGSEIEAIIPEKYDYLRAREADQFSIPASIPYRAEGAGPMPGEDLDFKIDPVAIRRLARMMRLLSQISDALSEPETGMAPEEALAGFIDTSQYTWGLASTRVVTSRFSGRGVRVAVIDTGLDITHRDFRGRRIVRGLFAPAGTRMEPTNSHGTHCAGTACGARSPATGPRYGVGYETEIYALKVFNDAVQPGARRFDVLTAMDFANRSGCRILSLSLGSATNGAIDPEYALAIARLRRMGSLTVAAAGNEGRQGYRVGAPASSPDAVAVAAVDPNLRRADFSCTGALDISGPGVNVLSSVIGGGTQRYSGTSMATPHVAGIAALWLQANPGWTVDQLETTLRRTARRLPQSAAEVGVGLVQAPQ